MKKRVYNNKRFRGVAQSGRVLGLGPRCRRFESFRPDQKIQTDLFRSVLIFSKRGERMRQNARHIYVPHGNEVYVNNWRAWRIRRRTIRKIIKTEFFNTSFYRFLLLFVEEESTRRRKADESMPVSNANEPRERSPNLFGRSNPFALLFYCVSRRTSPRPRNSNRHFCGGFYFSKNLLISVQKMLSQQNTKLFEIVMI